MEVILLEKILNLGSLGDRVRVKPGYARNYLVPQGKALPATEVNIAVFEGRRSELEKAQADELAAAEARAREMEAITLRIERKVGEGRLFGSVGPADVADALTEAGAEVRRNEVRLPDGHPIRNTGEFEIKVHVHPDVDATVRLIVVSDQEGEEALEAADEGAREGGAGPDPDAGEEPA